MKWFYEHIKIIALTLLLLLVSVLSFGVFGNKPED